MIEIRRMNRADKIQYPGAVEFYHGQPEPLIANIQVDNKPVTIIIDEHGLLFGWGEQYYNWREKRLHLQGNDLLNVLFQFENEMTKESLREILSNYCCRLEV